jgi:hypothetical protein
MLSFTDSSAATRACPQVGFSSAIRTMSLRMFSGRRGRVTTFSDSSLDGSLFDVPAGYTQIQVDPAVIMAGRTQARQPPQSK